MSRKNVQKNLVQKKLGVQKQVLKNQVQKSSCRKSHFWFIIHLVFSTPGFFYTYKNAIFLPKNRKIGVEKTKKVGVEQDNFRQVQNKPGVEKTGCRIGQTLKNTLIIFLPYRFSSKFRETEKKIISHWPFCEFRPKIELQRL